MEYILYIKIVWQFLISDDVGKIISLLGTCISIYVGLTVWEIKKRVLFKYRGPELATSLQEKASTINSLMLSFEDSLGQIDTEIAICLELLKNANEKLTGVPKSTIKTAIGVITKFRKLDTNKKSRDKVREIYTHVLASRQAILNQIEDQKMEP